MKARAVVAPELAYRFEHQHETGVWVVVSWPSVADRIAASGLSPRVVLDGLLRGEFFLDSTGLYRAIWFGGERAA